MKILKEIQMKKQLVFLALMVLAGCETTQKSGVSSLGSDDFEKSKCFNCQLKPFYVDGHWVEERD